MYDEIERAVTGRPRRGFPRFGWVAVGVVAVLALGVGGSMWAYHALRIQIGELTERIREEPVVRVSEALAATLAEAFEDLEPIAKADPSLRREIASHLQAAGLDQEAVRNIVEGSLRIHGRDGDIIADLQGHETGGSLLVRSPDGEVRVDVARSDHGGELVIVGDDRTLHLGAGEAAHDVPDWVPSVDGMPATPRKRLSASAGEGEFGIVTWEIDDEPDGLVDTYRARLDEEGYEVRAEYSLRGENRGSASVVGKDESSGRMVFLAVNREGEGTRAVLGYGEENR